MDDELIARAKVIWQERVWGVGQRGPLYGEPLTVDDGLVDPWNLANTIRSLVETIAVLEARLERLEKQQ